MVRNEKGSILKNVGIVVCIFIAVLFGILIGSSNNENNNINNMGEYNALNQIEENLNIGLENNVIIEYEEIENIRNEVENTEKVESEKIETTDKVENTEKVEKIEKIKTPMSSTSAWKEDYKEVEKKFKDAGFTKVTLKKIEDAKPNGFWVKAGQVKDVYIGGDSSFYLDDEFDKNAEVVIEYHTYPSVKYTKVSAKTLINALEKNAATAKEKYLDEYLEISGVVRNIDADLDYITISSNSTEWDTIQCYINNKDTEKKVKKISKGDKIVVRGQISSVGEILGYSLYITEIVK